MAEALDHPLQCRLSRYTCQAFLQIGGIGFTNTATGWRSLLNQGCVGGYFALRPIFLHKQIVKLRKVLQYLRVLANFLA